jgi:hypothetical protein
MPEKESGELYALGVCLHEKRDGQKCHGRRVWYVANWEIEKREKIMLKKACRQSGEPDKQRRAHPKRKTNASNPLEWKRQGEWEIF